MESILGQEFIEFDPWLANVIEKPVYRLILNSMINGSNRIYNADFILPDSLREVSVFVYAKVPTSSLDMVKHLNNIGFYLVDTNVTLSKPINKLSGLKGSYELRFALPIDEKQVCYLAGSAFKYSRFHMDYQFSNDMANHIKEEWVRNYFIGKRGQYMVVAINKCEIVGFLQLLCNDGILTIDLIAVDSAFHGKGIAQDMINFAESSCSNTFEFRVGTQINNIQSLRLYERAGFRMTETHYVLHYHL